MAKDISTEAVMQHHGQALTSGNLDEVMKDYTEDSVLFTPSETFKGLDGIKTGFTLVMKMLTPEAMANFKVIKQEIQGDYVYILWTAPPVIPFAGDAFYIRNGKIMMQAVFFPAGR
jgi:ketosteroid isomerase-like protein